MKSEDIYSFNVNKGLNKTLHNYRSMTVCHISLIKSKANNVLWWPCAILHWFTLSQMWAIKENSVVNGVKMSQCCTSYIKCITRMDFLTYTHMFICTVQNFLSRELEITASPPKGRELKNEIFSSEFFPACQCNTLPFKRPKC